MKNILYTLLLLGFLNVKAQNTAVDKIDSLLTYLEKNNKFKGSVTLLEGEKELISKSYGAENKENNILKIGSITKSFTAVLVLKLIEDKKLELSTTLATFYPKIKNAETITIEDLLRHQSGIPDYVNQNTITAADYAKGPIQDVILENINSYESLFEPKSQFLYSNTNYFLLGKIVEKLNGKSYAFLIENRIAKRLRLQNTFYPTSIEQVKQKVTPSFELEEDKWYAVKTDDYEVAFAAGGICSTTKDISVFYKNLMEGKLLKPESVLLLKEIEHGYGLGIMRFPFGERQFFGHGGKIENYNSTAGYYPKDKLSIAVIANAGDYTLNDIVIGVLSIYYKMPYRFPEFKKIDAKLVSKYSGVYATPLMPMKITVFEKAGQFFGQGTGQPEFPLTQIDDTTFEFPQAHLELKFNDKGMILTQNGQKVIFTKE